MAFWYPTLAVACIDLLFTAVAAILIRNYRPTSLQQGSGIRDQGSGVAWPPNAFRERHPGSTSLLSAIVHACVLLFLTYAHYLLYVLSAALQGSWVDGILSALVVAGLGGSLGWWVSARILKPTLVPIPRARLLSTHIPLSILTAVVTGLLFGGLGAWIGQLWK